VLTWVAQTRDPVLGGGLLFIYAMGIGVPFFLIGVFAMRLPKSGVWMEHVKSVFGIALLAMAVGYLRDGFPALREVLVTGVTMLGRNGAIGLGAALAFTGVVLGAVHLSFKEGAQWLPKSIGVTAVLIAFLVRMAAPAAALPPVTPGEQGGEFVWALTFKADQVPAPFDAALAQAKADCKPVMIDFFADWCAACKELDHLTYVSPEIVAEAKRFVTVKVDGTADTPATDALFKRFNVSGLPTVAFIDPMGDVLENPRVAGFLPPAQFLPEMRKIGLATCSRTP
jgi:thiol:disulfide interchange protein DsbD